MNEPRYSLSVFGDDDDDVLYDRSPPLPDQPFPATSMGAMATKTRGLFDRMLGRSPTDRPTHRGHLSLSVPILRPTTPKNDTARGGGGGGGSQSHSPQSRSPHSDESRPSTPSLRSPLLTINTLSNSERAEKVKRNRKVLQILGDIPFTAAGTGDIALDTASSRTSNPGMVGPPFHIRRHSSPITPVFAKEAVLSPRVLRRAAAAAHNPLGPSSSPSSSDSDNSFLLRPRLSFSTRAPHTAPLPQSTPPKPAPSVDRKSSSASIATFDTTSTISSLSDFQLHSKTKAELEHARKRATLAKLHQFLGSRIPPELVLGPYSPADAARAVLNPSSVMNSIETGQDQQDPTTPTSKSSPAVLTKLHRKPSVAMVVERTQPVAYVSDGDLDIRTSKLTPAQRAHIVRKKQKITKMLGVCPPNALMEQSGFVKDPDSRFPALNIPHAPGHSPLYLQHRYSINSLAYLVKKNNQEQLQDLLTYMKTDGEEGNRGQFSTSGVDAQSSFSDGDEGADARRNSTSSIDSTVTEHQQPPPSPTYSSVSSISALTPLPPQPNGFQQRRKRAAKLSSFFGVEYREFTKVLDTIESEVKSDRARGSLTAAEVQELLIKLRKLKAA